MIKELTRYEIDFVAGGKGAGWTASNICANIRDSVFMAVAMAGAVATIANSVMSASPSRRAMASISGDPRGVIEIAITKKRRKIMVMAAIAGVTALLIELGTRAWQIAEDEI